MTRTRIPSTVAVLLIVSLSAGCSERDLAGLKPAPFSDDPVVFDDSFGDGVDFQAFFESLLDAVAIDTDVAYPGTAASLRVTVPGPGAEGGTFAGGAFTSASPRDLSSYDALAFYAKSSTDNRTLNLAGLGNDNTGTSLYETWRSAIPLTTNWSRIYIPIPNPSRLNMERGLFFFAEGHENNAGYTIWFDEIEFVRLSTIASLRPAMATCNIESFVGASVTPPATRLTVAVNGEDVDVEHSHRFFDYFSSDETVAQATGGAITVVGGGTATLTAKLNNVDVEGVVTLSVYELAPIPDYPSDDVIALYCDVYPTVPVDFWRTIWSTSGPVEDIDAGGNAVKKYTGLARQYAGIEFTTQLIDASGMTHLRLDVLATEGSIFRVKLVDFGEDGEFPPADESELVFNALTEPAFVTGQWSVLDIPLADFDLDTRSHLAQLIISSPDVPTVFVDNVLFRR
jgi:hypothetical protein